MVSWFRLRKSTIRHRLLKAVRMTGITSSVFVSLVTQDSMPSEVTGGTDTKQSLTNEPPRGGQNPF